MEGLDGTEFRFHCKVPLWMAWIDIPLMLMLSAFKEMDFTEHCDHLKFLVGMTDSILYRSIERTNPFFGKGRSILQVKHIVCTYCKAGVSEPKRFQ